MHRTWMGVQLAACAMLVASCASESQQPASNPGPPTTHDLVQLECVIFPVSEGATNHPVADQPVCEVYVDGNFMWSERLVGAPSGFGKVMGSIWSKKNANGPTFNLPPAPHKIKVVAAGYETWERSITLSPYSSSQHISVELRQSSRP